MIPRGRRILQSAGCPDKSGLPLNRLFCRIYATPGDSTRLQNALAHGGQKENEFSPAIKTIEIPLPADLTTSQLAGREKGSGAPNSGVGAKALAPAGRPPDAAIAAIGSARVIAVARPDG
jgi:hypothetical protein